MYKQKCKGAKGSLMPTVMALAVGFVLFSICYTQVQDYSQPSWFYFIGIIIFIAVSMLIWRYSRVEMEYIWFGGELVIHRMDSRDRYRMIVRKANLLGLQGYGQSCGEQFYGGHARDACATLRGRVLECSILYCKDENGKKWRVYFQPTAELYQELQQVILEKQHSVGSCITEIS